jgi:uncharacterized protein (TIGR02996 family)
VRVVREIKKRLNSKKLAAEVAELVAALDEKRPPRLVAPPAKRVEAGPALPANATSDEIGAHLEASIANDPDVRDNYIVYGDWLGAAGDPRGALVAIGHQLAKNRGDHAMQKAHEHHLSDHAQAVMGSLASCEDMLTEVAWFMGFIKSCRVATTRARDRGKLPFVRVADVVHALLDDPGPARFLQDLTVGIVRYHDNSYDDVTAALARRPRPSLRRLFLGDFESEETELNWSRIGDLSALWASVTELRHLILRSGTMTIGPIDLPKLESLTTITGGLDDTSCRAIGHARWPALTTISLMVGRRSEGACTTLEPLLPLLRGDQAPTLRSLGILNCEFSDEVVRELADSKLTPRLAELDLSMGTLSDDGAQIIEARRDQFAHLRLVVDDNYLTPEGMARLSKITRELVGGDQRDDEGGPANRYASMYE